MAETSILPRPEQAEIAMSSQQRLVLTWLKDSDCELSIKDAQIEGIQYDEQADERLCL